MHRFIVDPHDIKDDIIEIKNSEYNHMINVLRVMTGENVVVTDNSGFEYLCEFHENMNKKAILKVLSMKRSDKEPRIKVTLYQALPKNDKMEYIIQKCVELGITKIYPVNTKRAIVKIDPKKEKNKIERWNR